MTDLVPGPVSYLHRGYRRGLAQRRGEGYQKEACVRCLHGMGRPGSWCRYKYTETGLDNNHIQVLTKAPELLEPDPEGALTAIVSGREVEATESSGDESEELRVSDDSGGG